MKKDLNRMFRNIGFSIVANAVSMLVVGVSTIVIPKFMADGASYGYWQLYLFYVSYIGLLHFGLQDGLFVRYGGTEYTDLDYPVMHSQVRFLALLESLIGAGVILLSSAFVPEEQRRFVWMIFGICCVIYQLDTHLQIILQMTNRIKDFAKVLIAEKCSFAVFLVVVLGCGLNDFRFLLLADLGGKLVGLLLGCFYCREIVFSKNVARRKMLSEVKKNLSVGLLILLANLSGLLVIGIFRFFIEKKWDITTFGTVSLAFSLCNFIISFLIAVGQVIFPLLKKTDQSNLKNVYHSFDLSLLVLVALALLAYQPIQVILSNWLPDYAYALKIFSVLFPLCIYESKVAMLTNVYFKLLGKFRHLLFVNLISMANSLLLAVGTILFFKNLEAMIFATLIACVFHGMLSEMVVSHFLQISAAKSLIVEAAVTVLFVVVNWNFSALPAFLIYLVFLLMTGFFIRKDMRQTFVFLRRDF